jgi:hypothetical protein
VKRPNTLQAGSVDKLEIVLNRAVSYRAWNFAAFLKRTRLL